MNPYLLHFIAVANVITWIWVIAGIFSRLPPDLLAEGFLTYYYIEVIGICFLLIVRART